MMAYSKRLTALKHSPYLRGLIDRFPDVTDDIDNLAYRSLDALAGLNVGAGDFGEKLVDIKARFALGWSALSLSKAVDFQTLGELQTTFAEQSINAALQAAWNIEARAIKLKPDDIPLTGLCVFGLGKLGGRDLNFSSDVDLIAFYDPDIFPVPQTRGHSYIANKILRRMTQFLKPRNQSEFVWRLDWRLRPEQSSSQLAMPIEMAEAFYFFRALPWHRLALMKARPIAGDIDMGARFLTTLAPFIWRQNLDYRTLDELAHLKSRINLEHPDLREERQARDPIMTQAAGFNIKLGSGGIREIEFIVNGQQLIWGGKIYNLRIPNTLNALDGLVKSGKLDPVIKTRLADIYQRHRCLENAVQMLDNQQTHLIPKTRHKQTALTKILGWSWPELCAQIYDDRCFVNAEFTRMFSHFQGDETPIENLQKKPARTTTNKSPVHGLNPHRFSAPIEGQLSNLLPPARDIAEIWLSGFRTMRAQTGHDSVFRTLGETLLKHVFTARIDPNEAIGHVQNFLKDLSGSDQYLHLLARHDSLVSTLIPPLLHSPHMTTLLRQSPHIIDIFLSEPNLQNTDFIFASQDYETRLERLRRFVNENLFQNYSTFMNAPKTDNPAQALHKNLTRLSEATLDASLKIVAEDIGLSVLPMTVLGMGNMGSARMSPLSDLDLVFIFEDSTDPVMSQKIVRRLRTVLTAKMREGIAYELDMRLRPSGRAGPPAVLLKSFRDHHHNRAHNWEHIALVNARIVAGDRVLGAKVMQIAEKVLGRSRDIAQFKFDASTMWDRIATQRLEKTPPDHLRSKLRPGGLMQAEFTQACYRILGQTNENVEISQLDTSINFWSGLQLWERLLGLTGSPITDVPEFYIQSFLSHFNVADRQELSLLQTTHTQKVCESYDGLLKHASVKADHKETRIIWTDN